MGRRSPIHRNPRTLHMKALFQFVSSAFALLTLATAASAQLDLPDSPKPRPKDPGVDLPRAPRGDVAPNGTGGQRGGLELPGTNGSAASEAPAASGPVAPGAETPEAVLAGVRGLRSGVGAEVNRAGARLIDLGPEGLQAARAELSAETPGSLVAAARAMVMGGTALDRQRVRARLDGKVPRRAAAPLVDLLEGTEPPATRPGLLIELAENRSGGVRRAALDALRSTALGPAALLGLKASRYSEVREHAFTALGALDPAGVEVLGGPEALYNELFAGFDDTSTKVRLAAARGLAARVTSVDDALTADLIREGQSASPEGGRGGLALFALVEAEDRLGRALLPEDDALFLLILMRQGEPFTRAVAATALAGVGFRSSSEVEWLDDEVVVALIQGIAGESYFPEFSALQPATLRRLERITGQTFGAEGPVWKSWWSQNQVGFEALRAVLPATLAEHALIGVRWLDPRDGRAFRLLGQAAPQGDLGFPGPMLRLGPADSVRLTQTLLESGALSAERLPGLQGAKTGVEPQLVVSVGEASKGFRIGVGGDAEWVQPLVAVLDELEAANEWQLYPPSSEDLPEGVDFFDHESAWWHTERTHAERAERLAGLILENMRMHDPLDRSRHVDALGELSPGTLGTQHFEALADRFAEEDFLGERARELMYLALAAGLEGRESLTDDAAGRLLDVLVTQGGAGRTTLLTEVAEAARPDFARTLALDPRAELRGVAARALAGGQPTEEDKALLRQLLVDSSSSVEASAVLAIAEANLGEFQSSISERAQAGELTVRVAALRGLGLMGGSDAVAVLRSATIDSNLQVKLAGVQALADLADPRATTLLTQMFAGGDTSPFFAPARRGLLRIGEPAWDNLLVMARTDLHPAEREAMFVLSEQGVTEIMTTLLQNLTNNPGDTQLARELAILTGVDFGLEDDPAREWWVWHDGHRNQSALGWFADAANESMETSGELDFFTRGYSFEEGLLAGEGTAEGAEVLIEFLRTEPDGHLERRAVRELRRILNEWELSLPPAGRMRGQWCDVLLTRIPDVFEANARAAEARERLVEPGSQGPAVEDEQTPSELDQPEEAGVPIGAEQAADGA